MEEMKQRPMDAAERVEAPADFELVLGRGIHPFYLDMEVDQVFEAAVGWKILSIKRDPPLAVIKICFAVRGKCIEVELMNTLHFEPGAESHYRVYAVSTEDLQFSDGSHASRLKKESILARFTGENELVKNVELSDDEADDYAEYFWSKNREIFFVFDCNGKELFVNFSTSEA